MVQLASFGDSVGLEEPKLSGSSQEPKSSGKTGSERSQIFRMFGRFRWRLGQLKLCGPHHVRFLDFSMHFVVFFLKVDEEDGYIYHKDEVMSNADDTYKKSLETYMLLYCHVLSTMRVHCCQMCHSQPLS